MQGIQPWIPTERKVAYLSALIEVGFDVLDAGSFVSPKAVPQMKDTGEVLERLPETSTRLLVIVANERGGQDAVAHERVDVLGFPFSISETFQLRNTGAGIKEGWRRVDSLRNLVERSGRELVVYLSMGFGNPYGDAWSPELAAEWAHRLRAELDVRHIALSDTVGQAGPELVEQVCRQVVAESAEGVIGAHLHGRRDRAMSLMEAAWLGGCRHFDGAIGGWGGCPMAKDELVGNLPTELLMEGPPSWGGRERHWNRSAVERALRLQAELLEGLS